MEEKWNDADAQDQFEREQRIWIAKAARKRESQSSLLWGFGAAVILLIAVAASSLH